MKRLTIILLSFTLALTASAQRGNVHVGGGGHYIRPRVTVVAPIYPSYGLGYGYGYAPYGYAPFGYNPFYSSPFIRDSRPTKLDLQMEDIKNDYAYQISSARNDKSLSKDERKQKVRDLKHERDEAIIDAKKDYYDRKDSKHEAS